MKILVPASVRFDADHEDLEVVRYNPKEAIAEAHTDAEALVVWGMPDDRLAAAAEQLTSLKWVQLLSAGADSALAAGFADGVTITSGRSLHDATVSEHALALTLAAARRLHTLVRTQIGHRWAGEIGGVQPEHDPDVFTTLRGARVVIWGFGSIGATLAPLLRMLGATVTGVATRRRTEDGVEVIVREDLPDVLPETDVLIMILPSTPETRGALDSALLERLPAHAWVVNVGRGTTVVQDDLIDALRARTIGGAALDVTEPEPLPIDSALWDLPNTIITPHAAGGRPVGAARLIEANLLALREGRVLENVVAR